MLEKVTDRIYYLEDDDSCERPTLGVVKGDNCCLVYDAGNSPAHAEKLLNEIEEMNLPPVKYVVISHHHWDHTFGMEKFNAIKIASVKTAEACKIYKGISLDIKSLEEAVKKGIFPDDTIINVVKDSFEGKKAVDFLNFDLLFSGELKIDLGGITCEIKEIVNPHREDGTIMYVPEENTLFVGDAAYGRVKDEKSYYESSKLTVMMEEVESYNADYCLCGHEPMCPKEEMARYFGNLRMGRNIKSKCNSFEEAKLMFKQLYKREPSNLEMFFLETLY